jgi:hypothetical protein
MLIDLGVDFTKIVYRRLLSLPLKRYIKVLT